MAPTSGKKWDIVRGCKSDLETMLPSNSVPEMGSTYNGLNIPFSCWRDPGRVRWCFGN